MKNANCSNCNKSPAVLYVTKMENGQYVKAGFCLKCGRDLKIKPVEDLISKMGLSDDDLDNSSELNADDDESTESKSLVMDTPVKTKRESSAIPENNNVQNVKTAKKCRFLEKYCQSLSKKAADNKIDSVIGRESETERVVQILSRRQKNNPCLIGEPGVGKTAIAEGLALRIYNGTVPNTLLDKEVYSLDMAAVLAGTMYRGMFEERVKGVVEDVQRRGDVILFIDEIHNLIGSGTMDAANILKPALARGEFQVIGATTSNEYKMYIESDTALERRLQPVKVDEPSVLEAIEIMKGIKGYYESFHRVKVSDEMAEQAVLLSDKYISDRFLPDKAIDLIDEACANLNINRKPGQKSNPKLTKDNLARVVELWTKIPACSIDTNERKHLADMETRLKAALIGQDKAIESVCAAIKRKRLGISAKHKPASFIFIGSTGIGKTELVKQLALNLYDSKNAFIRLDMSEYMEYHTESKLIGAPPGYVGYKEGGQLTDKIREKPNSILLLDEIEKAHPKVMDVFLQILDEGHLTDNKGRTVDFKNTTIIMTSNAGSIDKTVGFNKPANECTKEANSAALKRFLKPEFINRVDEIIYFNHLTKDDIKAIARIMLDDLRDSLAEQPITLQYDNSVIDYLAENTDFETYGARNLYHLIQKEIEDRVATEMLTDSEVVITVIDLSVIENAVKIEVK